jgi:hypothetical protein
MKALSEQAAIISLSSVNQLIFVMETFVFSLP